MIPIILSDLLILAVLLRRKHLVEAVRGWAMNVKSHNKKRKRKMDDGIRIMTRVLGSWCSSLIL